MAAKARRRRKKKSAKRRLLDKIIIWLAFSTAVLALTVLLFIYWNRDTGIGDEQLELCLTGNTMNISWEDSEAVDIIRLYRYDVATDKNIFIGEYTDNAAVVPDVESGKELTLKFEPIRIKTVAGKSFEIKSRKKSVTIVPEELMVPNLTDTISVENQTVTVNWPSDGDYICALYRADVLVDGQAELLSEIEDNGYVLTIGDNLELPERGNPVKLQARTYKQEKNCKQYSIYGDILEITREELLPDEVSIACEFNMDGKYSFTWQEAKPDTYEFLQYNEDTDTWDTLQVTSADEPMRYQTDWLPSEKVVSYKLLAYFNNPSGPDEQRVLESPQLNVRSRRSPLYCTIWPVMDLDVYSDANGGEVIGKVKAGETLCVLEDTGEKFRVRTGDQEGYLDERYVLINLPEYLGDLCHYNITNSYSSIFKVAQYAIPEMTDTVIPGFENTCINEEEHEFVVPYLYPCANRLASAAEAASSDNYVLNIYEAFRPHEATRYMYDTTEQILNGPVPFLNEDGTEVGVPNKEEDEEAYNAYCEELQLALIQQIALEGIDPESDAAAIRMLQLIPMIKAQQQAAILLQEEGIDPASAPGQVLLNDMIAKQPTYLTAMTNGSMKLSAFLAKTISAHNRGIALDLTLEERETSSDIEMQSAMHDLSYNSVSARNNDNAKLLESYMKGVGFNGLTSEWWHFQDDETRNELNLGVYLENGVSLKGFKNNNVGWRYQLENGEFLKGTTQTIDGRSYTFNEKGYCTDF